MLHFTNVTSQLFTYQKYLELPHKHKYVTGVLFQVGFDTSRKKLNTHVLFYETTRINPTYLG